MSNSSKRSKRAGGPWLICCCRPHTRTVRSGRRAPCRSRRNCPCHPRSFERVSRGRNSTSGTFCSGRTSRKRTGRRFFDGLSRNKNTSSRQAPPEENGLVAAPRSERENEWSAISVGKIFAERESVSARVRYVLAVGFFALKVRGGCFRTGFLRCRLWHHAVIGHFADNQVYGLLDALEHGPKCF